MKAGLKLMILCGLTGLGATSARAQTASTDDLTPGSVQVHLNGRFRAFFGDFDDSEFNQTNPDDGGTAKQSDLGMTELVRLYPGVDGVTPGGLAYGANIELRQENFAAPDSPARGGIDLWREWGYIGTPTWGTLRFGTQDGASSLFIAGTMENFDDGGWNGDVAQGLVASAQIPWPFADANYMPLADKLVYLSPALETDKYGRFDLGLSFEPNGSGVSLSDGDCPFVGMANGVGCNRLSSTGFAPASARRLDTTDIAGRWRAVWGPVGTVVEAAYTHGSHVNYSGPQDLPGFNSLGEPVSTRAVSYNGLNLADIGAALTYAGIQVGANGQFGRFNNSLASGQGSTLALAPKGAKAGSAFVTGASYTFGPAVVGASYLDVDTAGAYTYQPSVGAPGTSSLLAGLGQRRQTGVAAGGTVKLVPGVGMYLSYLYGEQHQADYDFVTGTSGSAANNSVHSQAITLGTSLTW